MTQKRIRLLAVTGLFAALITLFTAFFVHIPIGTNGGYLHFGDTLIYLAASILPAPYAIAAAVIGGGLADLLTAPMWTAATVIVKALLVLPFTSRSDGILNKRNYAAPWAGLVITVVGYYVAEAILFGGWAAFIASVSGNLIQAGGSAIFYYAIAFAFDKAGVKRRSLGLIGAGKGAG